METLRGELTEIEKQLREANEMELPEEKFRVAAAQKRKELTELMAKFAESNSSQQTHSTSETNVTETATRSNHPKYERPSERRKRLEKQTPRNKNYNEVYQSDVYSSFGGRQHNNYY